MTLSSEERYLSSVATAAAPAPELAVAALAERGGNAESVGKGQRIRKFECK